MISLYLEHDDGRRTDYCGGAIWRDIETAASALVEAGGLTAYEAEKLIRDGRVHFSKEGACLCSAAVVGYITE